MCCELESTQIGCVCVGGEWTRLRQKMTDYFHILCLPAAERALKNPQWQIMSVSCYLSGNNMGNVLHLVELIGQEVTAFLHQGEYWGVSCWSTYSSVIDHSAYNFLISNPLGDLTGSSHFS